jgi:hypothetical protein
MSHVQFQLSKSNEKNNTMQVFQLFVMLSIVGFPSWGVVCSSEYTHTSLQFTQNSQQTFQQHETLQQK